MIIEEIDESLFISRFEDYKRVVTLENKGGNFTYKGLRVLFAYLDEISDEENPIKLDVIALCCDFLEYKDLDEFLNDRYTTEEINEKVEEITGNKGERDLNEDERTEFKAVIENEINDETTLIKFGDDLDDGFIIQSY